MNSFTKVLRMIQFEHSVFALPFAFAGAWMAAGGTPPWQDLSGIIAATVFARSSAMAMNRWADRCWDATNSRTQNRELVTGSLSSNFVFGFSLLCGVLFVATAFWLAPICGWFSLPVLAVLWGYSYLKRWTWICHLGLGLALGCAPTGAWLAINKNFLPGWTLPLWVGVGVLFWTAGFDLLYSIQDRAHDKKEALFSIPSRFGTRVTQRLAICFHFISLGCFAVLVPQFSWHFQVALVVLGALFFLQHWMLRGGRYDCIPTVFFRVNAWVGPIFFAGLWAALEWGPGTGNLVS